MVDLINKLVLLRERLLEGMARLRIPGVALGLIVDGLEYTICEGVTHRFHPLEITRDTLFQIGSTTKTITGTIIMRLVEAGKLELDAPVRRYLPDLQLADEATAAQVTVRQLLNHTGGWVGDLFSDTGDGDDALEKYVQGVIKQPQVTATGTIWHYNNAGFGIAGRIIEVMSGKTYEQVAQEMILEPLGMTKSHFFPAETMLERFAVGHFVDASGQVQISRPWAFARAIAPIGRLNSSVLDQLKYAQFHLGDGAPLLQNQTLQVMQTPTVKGALGNQFAVTWFVRDVPWKNGNGTTRVLSHGGATNGQMSAFWIVPEANFACTILTNSDKGTLLNNELSAWIQEEFLGLKEPESKVLEPTESELEAYTGSFVGAAFGTTLEFYLENKQLKRSVKLGDVSSVTVTPAPPPPVATCALLPQDTIVLLDTELKGSKYEYLRNDQNQIVWLRAGGRLYAKQN